MRMYLDLTIEGLAGGLLLWLALLALIVGGRVLNGDIRSTGFLHTTRNRKPGVAPERALSMMIFPFVIVSYAYTALHADINVAHPAMPDLDQSLLMLLTGGNGVYLAGKIARLQ
jgi:hypothetical protein